MAEEFRKMFPHLQPGTRRILDSVWNVMAHAQKPDFVFRRNGRVHLNRWGASVQSTTGSRVVRMSGSNAGYTMFRGSVKSTGYPLPSPVSPSLSLPHVTVCRHISTGLCTYRRLWPHSMWHGRLPVKTAVTKFVFLESYNKYPNKIQYGHKRGAWITYLV